MKEKPPVLTNPTIAGISLPKRDLLRGIATAQRDADVAYYEPIIKQLKNIGNIQRTQEALMGKLDDVELAIQQAKAEVARGIFEEIEWYYCDCCCCKKFQEECQS